MGKQRLKKGDIYKITHNTFFEETFGLPSFGIAFLKKTLPRSIHSRSFITTKSNPSADLRRYPQIIF